MAWITSRRPARWPSKPFLCHRARIATRCWASRRSASHSPSMAPTFTATPARCRPRVDVPWTTGSMRLCSRRIGPRRRAPQSRSSAPTPPASQGLIAASSPCRWETDMALLSAEETRRYARHLVLKGVGGEGQQKLRQARVLVIGAGGLGSPVIAYLAAAGGGMLGVVDDDEVSLSNLQRQIVHTTGRVGAKKTESASAFVAGLNPHVVFEAIPRRINKDNASLIVGVYDLVVDGCDNLETRRVVAEA